MSKPLLIYGAGGLGREVLSLVRGLEAWEPVGFIDDSIARNTVINNIKVLGGLDVLQSYGKAIDVVFAIGDPVVKSMLVKRIDIPYVTFPVLLHPSVIIQDEISVRLGNGSIVTAGCILTTNITIGEHVLINLNTTIGHDVHIGNYSSIMPGVNIAGEAYIGESVLIGSGTNILNRIHVGDRSTVGMGTVVIRNVEADVTVAGVPAKQVH